MTDCCLSPSYTNTSITDTCYCAQFFHVGSGDQTRVLMLTQKSQSPNIVPFLTQASYYKAGTKEAAKAAFHTAVSQNNLIGKLQRNNHHQKKA